MKYEPPNGMADFVRVLQRCSAESAAQLLRMSFDDAGAVTLLADMRLRAAAPTLLLAVLRALEALDRHEPLDRAELVLAITVAAEGPEALTRG